MKDHFAEHRELFIAKSKRWKELIFESLEILAPTLLVCENADNGQVDTYKWWFGRNDKFIQEHFAAREITDAKDQQAVLVGLIGEYNSRRANGDFSDLIKRMKEDGALPASWQDYYQKLFSVGIDDNLTLPVTDMGNKDVDDNTAGLDPSVENKGNNDNDNPALDPSEDLGVDIAEASKDKDSGDKELDEITFNSQRTGLYVEDVCVYNVIYYKYSLCFVSL